MRFGRALRGPTLVSFEVVTLALLLRLDLPTIDWSDPSAWLENAHPEDAVIALVRLAAIVTVGYLLATTALYVLASLTRVPALIRATSAITLPSLRRVVDGAVAAVIVVSPASLALGVGPAAAQSAPISAHVYSPSPAGDPSPGYTPTPAGGTTTRPAESVYVVRPGDSLWTIAVHHVATARGISDEEVNADDVAVLWRTLVELNASSLSSGDPDLIYPGESIRLPAI